MTLTERTLLRVAGQVDARDMVMVPSFGPAQTAKEALRAVGAGDTVAIGKLVIDPLDHILAVQRVPARRLVGVDLGPERDVIADITIV